MRCFLTAEWRYLVMLNYSVDPALLRPLVPAGTELDLWNGTAFASMVGFRFERTSVLRLPVPLHRNFPEVNLRFYVRRRTQEGWRRGVVFVKEIVPRRAIAAVARLQYNEPYVALPMRHRLDAEDDADGGGGVEYAWRHQGRWNSLGARMIGDPRPHRPGSEEQFIAEHYWGYTARRDGGTREYRVEHAPWRLWRVEDPFLQCDVASLYGPAFAEALAARPQSAFVAEGSPVSLYLGRTL